MNPIFKVILIVVVAWVLLSFFVPLIVGVPAIIKTLVTLGIVLGAIYLGWKTIETL